jgi:hypothetical protein
MHVNRLALYKTLCYNNLCMVKTKKETITVETPVTDLKTFIENVNKKDRRNGLKITFGFTKRKKK